MGTSFRGAFVIAWSQTELDGLADAPCAALRPGAVWAWRGDMVRVDGPGDVLQLAPSVELEKLRARMGLAVEDPNPVTSVHRDGFTVTDGSTCYTVAIITGPAAPLLFFLDDVPPKETELWVVSADLPRSAGAAPTGVICFAAGTQIETPQGRCRVEDLRVGDMVATRDNGAQEIIWRGARRMSGARLFAMPELRPIRIGQGALGLGEPDEDLLVSPDHRLMLSSDRVHSLYNTKDVLVSAGDLVDGQSVTRDTHLREVTYVHIMFAEHQILTANGILCESFHPSGTSLDTLAPDDRDRLISLLPDMSGDRSGYGPYARRTLSGSEAALLRHPA